MSNEFEKQLADIESKLAEVVAQKERDLFFEQESQQRFNTNLQAFQKYYPDVYKTINEYKKRDDFKFIVREGGFADFIPSGQTIPLYGVDIKKTVASQIDRYRDKAFFSMTKYGFGLKGEDLRIHIRYMHALDKQLADFYAQELTPITQLPPHFPSAIIFGIGLGYHIPLLLEQHSFDYLFICEPDLELFYASLYCIDWAAIIQDVDEKGKTLFLQVGVSYKDFFATLSSIATDVGAFSLVRSYCYQHYPSEEVNKLILEFFNKYGDLQLGFGFYNDAITGLAHGIENLNQGYELFYADPKAEKLPYADVPVFVIGNGPSLDDAVELLKQVKDRALIFASGTALGSLLKMGIDPDFHVLVERPKITYDILLDTQPKEVYEKLNLLTVDVMYPDVLDLYQWAGVGLKGPEAATYFIYQYVAVERQKLLQPMPYCGPLVVNTALSFAVSMGFKEIYLVGVDNGYINKATHSKFSIYSDESLDFKRTVNKNANNKLEGNFGGTVMATDLLKVAKIQIESLIKTAKNTSFYNVGFGAKLEGAHPLTVEDVLVPKKTIDKAAVVADVKNRFFIDFKLNIQESDINFKLLDEVCEHMISIAKEPVVNRVEASDLLMRQARYLYAFSETRYAYIFNIIKGSLLYYHCPMLTMLYSFEEEKETMEQFEKFRQLWIDYLTDIKNDFPLNWNTKCDWGLEHRDL